MRQPFAWPSPELVAPAVRNQDVIHVQFPFYLGARAITLARQAGIPVVSTFHVQAEHILYNIGIRSQPLVNVLYRLFLRTVYNRSDHVTCPSDFAQRELRGHGLTASSSVISNGVPPVFRPLPRGAGPDFGDKLVIYSVGRLAREKRHGMIIEAVRRSRYRDRIQLVILGAGPLRGELEAEGKSLTNPPVFQFLSADDLVKWYSAGHLCVHASEVEVECMSVLEAMACGLPCLIADSDRSATPQFALSSDYLFAAGQLDDLVQKMDRLLDQPEALLAARHASHEAAQGYRIDTSLQKLLGVYASVTARRPAVVPSGSGRDRLLGQE
jgi:glycosyltransferase involved in cell wall biosynthesis